MCILVYHNPSIFPSRKQNYMPINYMVRLAGPKPPNTLPFFKCLLLYNYLVEALTTGTTENGGKDDLHFKIFYIFFKFQSWNLISWIIRTSSGKKEVFLIFPCPKHSFHGHLPRPAWSKRGRERGRRQGTWLEGRLTGVPCPLNPVPANAYFKRRAI